MPREGLHILFTGRLQQPVRRVPMVTTPATANIQAAYTGRFYWHNIWRVLPFGVGSSTDAMPSGWP